MEIEKINYNNTNKPFETTKANLSEQEEINFAGTNYPVHLINFHYASGLFDSGSITLEDGTKWYDPEARIQPAYFPNWKSNDRVIILDSMERSGRRGYQKFFYNLENGEVCKLYRLFN